MNFDLARKHMVDSQVRPNDVTELRILDALETAPREKFLPPGLCEQAYVEREITYAPGRAMITARDFSKLLAALSPEPKDLVLDVACGTGYSSAVLSMLAEMVVAVESDEALAGQAQDRWAEMGVVNAAVIIGDPAAGAARQGPFDLIVIAAAIEITPEALLSQLKDGGRLGAILRADGTSRGVIWRRSGAAFGATDIFDASARVVAPWFTRPKVFAF